MYVELPVILPLIYLFDSGFRLIKLAENVELHNFTTALNNETGSEFNVEQLKTKVLLIYDAVKVFYEAIKKMENVSTTSLSCDNYETWSQGSTLLNFMKTVSTKIYKDAEIIC